MYLLEVEPLDLGSDVKAIGLELVEPEADREPVRGKEAAQIWSRIFPAIAAAETWVLDFFSHLERIRAYCDSHQVSYREASSRSIVVPSPDEAALSGLLERFEGETFGCRAGGPLPDPDPSLEADLAHRGADAYHRRFADYFFCGICDFENGSLVLLSKNLWASEIIRRIRPVISNLDVEAALPA